jgi:hypothetical protein
MRLAQLNGTFRRHAYLFEAERDAGVRTAGLLARQSPERLSAIYWQ